MYMQKSFQEVSKIWCDAKRPIVKHSTMCAYMLTLQTHLLPRFGVMTVITESDVQQFVIDKFSSGLARKTVRDLVAVLKSVAKYGGKHKIFPFEEWEVEYPTNTTARRLLQLYSPDAVKTMKPEAVKRVDGKIIYVIFPSPFL